MILPFVLGALGASCRSFKAIVLLFVLHALCANRKNLDQIYRSSGLTRNTVIFLLIVLNALGANHRILTKCLIFWINQEYSNSFAICFNCTLCKSKILTKFLIFWINQEYSNNFALCIICK